MTTPLIGKKNQGKSFNYFNRMAVANSSFNTEPDIIIPFATRKVIISVEGTCAIEMSCNGNTIAAEYNSATNRAIIQYDNIAMCLLWFKLKSGSGSIVVEAWG